jgi:hypothetical protein
MGKNSTPASTATTHVIPRPPADIVYPKGPYNSEEDALRDIVGLRYALNLFLASHMIESENFCTEMDPSK